MKVFRTWWRSWRSLVATDNTVRLLTFLAIVFLTIVFALLPLIFRVQTHRDEMMGLRDDLPMRDIAQVQRQLLLLDNSLATWPKGSLTEIQLRMELVQSRINLLSAPDFSDVFPEDAKPWVKEAEQLWAAASLDLQSWLAYPGDVAQRNSISTQLSAVELKFNNIYSETNFYGLNLSVQAEQDNNQLVWIGASFILVIVILALLFSAIVGRLSDIQVQSLLEKESISRFPEQNPNPVMRFNSDFKLVYGNSASKQLEQLLGLKDGEITRPKYRDWLKQILATGELIQTEGKVGEKVFRMVGSLVKEEQVINIYSFNVTEIKRAEMQARHQLERLNALRTIDLAIASSEGRDGRLLVVLEQTCQQLGMDAATIFVSDGASQLTCVASRGIRAPEALGARVPIGESLVGRVAAKRKPLAIPNLNQSKLKLPGKLAVEDSFQAYFAAPLLVRGDLLGVIETFSQHPFNPNRDWLDFLNTLAGQAAIAVDTSRLLDDLRQSNQELLEAYDTTLEGWAKALELRDEQTEGHSRRVTEVTMLIAKELKIPEEKWEDVRRGAILHDIGKMAVPDSILLKPGPLTDSEWEVMRRHTEYAYEMLSPIAFLREALDIPRYHHEKWDGSGYNFGLKGKDIPLAARIFAIADVWDALRAKRPYHDAMDEENAWKTIQKGRGSHFDPRVVDAFEEVIIKPLRANP